MDVVTKLQRLQMEHWNGIKFSLNLFKLLRYAVFLSDDWLLLSIFFFVIRNWNKYQRGKYKNHLRSRKKEYRRNKCCNIWLGFNQFCVGELLKAHLARNATILVAISVSLEDMGCFELLVTKLAFMGRWQMCLPMINEDL